MIINNNPDFSDEKRYKDDSWHGFSSKELLSVVVGLVVAVVVVYWLWKYAGIPLAIGPYIGVPLAAPIIVIGIVNYQGMSIFGILKEFLLFQKTKTLYWDTGAVPKEKTFSMKKQEKKEGGNHGGN